jgi:hypothetical protein
VAVSKNVRTNCRGGKCDSRRIDPNIQKPMRFFKRGGQPLQDLDEGLREIEQLEKRPWDLAA